MTPEIKKAIEKYYALKIQKYISAPRQFVAETYILDDVTGNQYFCKVIDKPLFIPGIIETLPVVEEMHAKGIDRIGYPIRGKKGLYLFIDEILIVLFNYIPASQGFDYSLHTLGKIIAKIHNITPNITVKPSKENFEFPNHKLFDERFEGTLTSQSIDPVIQEFKNLLNIHEKEVRHYMSELLRLAKLCKEESFELVLTHGDAPTNILVKSPDDIYIIDWDELKLAPAERDIWMVDEHPEFMEGYKSVRPDFIINRNMRSFCILQYYFERMIHYFSEILNESANSDYRLERVKKLAKGRMAGWILPKVEEINL